MTAGVAATYHRVYGWETYLWSTAYAPVAPASVPPVWNTCTLAAEGGTTRALAFTLKTNFDGLVSVPYGRRAGAYTATTTAVPVKAGVSQTIRLCDLRPGTTYYGSPVWSGTIANAAGLPISGAYQFGELSASTP